MELSHQNAMVIVTEISDIIKHHVNMMDETGTIIASTDPERVGTFHEGAAALIHSDMDELIIENEAQYKGARKGLNLPIMLNGRLTGVIGVTGEYREVIKYGQIIKKMTELMLTENYMNQQRKIDERIRTRFFDEWILNDTPITCDFIERGARLGIDVKLPYRVIVVLIRELKRYSDTPEGQILIDNLNRRVRGVIECLPNGIFTKTATKMICLVPEAYMPARIHDCLQAIKGTGREFGVHLYIGVDGGSASVHSAYLQASKAVQGCNSGRDICFYKDIGIELFMDEIPLHSRLAFVHRIFGGCTAAQIDAWVRVLQVYFKANGSIKLAAEQLYIHKNTMQYKLKKLFAQTGHDPKNIIDSALFYLAIQFHLSESE